MKRTLPPSSTAYARDRLRLAPEGILWLGTVGVIGFLGWWKSINAIFLLAYLMLALLGLNALLARMHLHRVGLVREPPPHPYAGEDVALRTTVTNRGARSATVVVRDDGAGVAVSTLVADLPAGASVPVSVRRTFPRRGMASARQHISSGYPFGLILMERCAWAGDLLVLPARGAFDADGFRRWLSRRSGDGDRSRTPVRSLASDLADVRGIRAYRAGDPIRTIHWRTSARRGQLMVREYDAVRAVDLVLVVEPWLPLTPSPREREDLEAALRLAATIAANWRLVYETRLTVAVAGDPDSICTVTPNDGDVREALAPVARVSGAPEFAPLTRAAFPRGLARVAGILVSSRPHSPYATLLTRSLGRPFAALSSHDRLSWYHGG